MIDIRRLKELVKLMVENDLSELDLRDQEETVKVKRGADLPANAPMVLNSPGYPANMPVAAPAATAPGSGSAGAPAAKETSTRDGLVAIESPMVGTYYSASSPDADPYLSVGASVSPGSVVCIVEAMKVFNEIKSEVDGTIERILVKNGDAVEFGQEICLVRPS